MKQSNPRRLRRPAASGFTLLEILIVIVLIALVASISLFTLKEPLARARTRSALDNLQSYDALVRSWARSHQAAAQLSFDLAQNTVAAQSLSRETPLQLPSLSLPRNLRLAAVRVCGESSRAAQTSVTVSSQGTTPSYAVALTGATGTRHTLLFTGMGGQALEQFDESYADELFAQAQRPQRNHAD